MRILLAVDDSPHSAAAIKSVLERPWPEGSTVRVLCVIQTHLPVSVANGGVGLQNYRALTDSLLKTAKEFVDLTSSDLPVKKSGPVQGSAQLRLGRGRPAGRPETRPTSPNGDNFAR